MLGQQVAGSLSPAIHNAAIAHLGLDRIYVPLPWSSTSLADLLKTFWDLGFEGLNITFPYKSKVAKLIPECQLHSVNTLSRGKDFWLGHSTDVKGLEAALCRSGMEPQSLQRLVILGAGGVVAAILEQAPEIFPSVAEIIVLARRADAAQEEFAAFDKRLKIQTLNVKNLQQALNGFGSETLFLQASSAPATGDDLGDYEDCLAQFSGSVMDLCYGKVSKLYFRAVAMGLKVQDGEMMLIEQARLAQEIWWGKAAPYDLIFQTLRRTRAG